MDSKASWIQEGPDADPTVRSRTVQRPGTKTGIRRKRMCSEDGTVRTPVMSLGARRPGEIEASFEQSKVRVRTCGCISQEINADESYDPDDRLG